MSAQNPICLTNASIGSSKGKRFLANKHPSNLTVFHWSDEWQNCVVHSYYLFLCPSLVRYIRRDFLTPFKHNLVTTSLCSYLPVVLYLWPMYIYIYIYISKLSDLWFSAFYEGCTSPCRDCAKVSPHLGLLFLHFAAEASIAVGFRPRRGGPALKSQVDWLPITKNAPSFHPKVTGASNRMWLISATKCLELPFH